MDEICEIYRQELGVEPNALVPWFLSSTVAWCSAVSKWRGEERCILTDGCFVNGGISDGL